jgi:hypothetical protein
MGRDEHFFWEKCNLIGKTPIGRATIDLLRVNDPARMLHRQLLAEAGLFPTSS